MPHYLRRVLRGILRAARSFASTLIFLLCIPACTSKPTPVAEHGHLSVSGNRIVNQHKQAVSLAGPSLFWGNKGWRGDRFFHAETVAYVKNNWNASIIRVAMGVENSGGIIHDWRDRMAKVKTVVDAAIAQGMYVIIDWHSHHAEDNPEAAQRFFVEMAQTYGEHPHVIYEIYNEPLDDTDWSTVIKPYAQNLIAAIRAVDPDNIIVVGTQSWSQDVDKAADDPLTGFSNIAYALHFYAGTHRQELRDKAEYALNKGLALMVTEWGAVNADGDGDVDRKETLRWLEFMRKHQLSHCNWSFNNKKEGASVFKPHINPAGPWKDKDLTESGLFVKDIIKNW